MAKRQANVVVYVTDPSNIDRALRKLRKQGEREGVSRDIKRRTYFEKPTQKRRKRLIRAIKQNLMRMISENLINYH